MHWITGRVGSCMLAARSYVMFASSEACMHAAATVRGFPRRRFRCQTALAIPYRAAVGKALHPRKASVRLFLSCAFTGTHTP